MHRTTPVEEHEQDADLGRGAATSRTPARASANSERGWRRRSATGRAPPGDAAASR